MVRLYFLIITLAVSLHSSAQKVREVWVAPKALFAFDPLTDRYERESLSSVATYVEAFRADGWDVRLNISAARLGRGTRIYESLEDSTLFNRVLTYLNASMCLDTISEKFNDNIYDFPKSRDFDDYFMADVQRIKHFYSTALCEFDSTLTFDPYGPSEVSRLIHDFQLSVTGADLSMFAPMKLSMKIDKNVYIRNIESLFYYKNDLVTIQMTGHEVRQWLENIYSARYFTLRNEQSDLLRSYLPISMHLSMSGANFTVNLTKEKGRRIENLELADDTIYSVVMNSFTAGKTNKETVAFGDYKYLLIRYLANMKRGEERETWRLKPERWVEKIKAREILEINNK